MEEYFANRHWHSVSLQTAVRWGLELEQSSGRRFTWLTATNAGAAEVCRAALAVAGIGEEDLSGGYLCDPDSKSPLRILARPGIKVRLTRNLDKQRGFVNGATGTVCESLCGNRVFTVQLDDTGNMVLVHPMEENGQLFLPCCYGYATTIRRAQGASLEQGCLWFDQRRFAAGRGYGYVGVSRFKRRTGVYLFGKLRRTDFLPVGEDL